MNNPEEVDKFLEKYNFPNWTKRNIKYEQANQKHGNRNCNQKSPNRTSGTDGFTGEFYQKFREEQSPILLKVFQKIKEEWKLSNSFYGASITLLLKPDKMPYTQKRK